MNFKRRHTRPDIMIIPMIDIIFFLLVFFMVSMASMVEENTIVVNLPKGETASSQEVSAIPISITPEGQVYIEKQQVPLQEVHQVLATMPKGEQIQVIVRADKKVPHGIVVAVLDEIRFANFYNIVIATE